MYRRHLKMVLAKDLESNEQRSEFVHRIASIPVVYFAWNIATETYKSIKSSNRLLRVSLTTTEKAAFTISKPVLRKFEKQLKTVDNLACKGLETIQSIVPSLRLQREKFYRQTRNVYEGTIDSGLKKYEFVKKISSSMLIEFLNEGTEKLIDFLNSPYGEVCEISIDFALEAGEMYVDHFLPPLGDERSEKLFGDRGKSPVPERMDLLKNRLKERLYKHSLLKMQLLRLKTQMILIKMYRFDLSKYVLEVVTVLPRELFTNLLNVFSSLYDLRVFLYGTCETNPA